MPTKHKKTNHETKQETKHETKLIEQEIPAIEENPVFDPVVVEKIVYKKQRVHGFFRTLTIIALLAIGFLLLGETMGIAKIAIGDFALDTIYPIFIIFSIIVIWSYRGVFGKLFGLILFLGVFGGFFMIRIYNGLDEQSTAKYGEQIAFQITGTKQENVSIKSLISNVEIEGNTKSPYVQGTRTSDRDMLTSTTTTGNQETILIQDTNTLNILNDFYSNLTLYMPSKTNFETVYLRSALGTENINTQDMHRQTLTIHGGLNKIVLDLNDVTPNATINIMGAAQDITINIPQEIGIMMHYKNRIGYKSRTNIDYKTGYLYASTNIDTAKTVLNLNISTFIGRVKINRE